MLNTQTRPSVHFDRNQGRKGNDPSRAVLFVPGYWDIDSRLRDPAFFRIFEPGAAVSRTFRKMGRRESRLVLVHSNQFRPKMFVGPVRCCLDSDAKNQAKSNLLKPNQTTLKTFFYAKNQGERDRFIAT